MLCGRTKCYELLTNQCSSCAYKPVILLAGAEEEVMASQELGLVSLSQLNNCSDNEL